jgi:hypothetical protein
MCAFANQVKGFGGLPDEDLRGENFHFFRPSALAYLGETSDPFEGANQRSLERSQVRKVLSTSPL